MTPADLESIGLAHYGPRWRSRMAEALGSDRSRVSRWAKPVGNPEHRPIPAVAQRRIRELAASALSPGGSGTEGSGATGSQG